MHYTILFITFILHYIAKYRVVLPFLSPIMVLPNPPTPRNPGHAMAPVCWAKRFISAALRCPDPLTFSPRKHAAISSPRAVVGCEAAWCGEATVDMKWIIGCIQIIAYACVYIKVILSNYNIFFLIYVSPFILYVICVMCVRALGYACGQVVA